MKNTYAIRVVLFCFIVLYSCKDKSTESSATFEGITETNATGWTPIGNADPDDWKPMMNCSGNPKILRISSTESIGKDTSIVTIPTCTKIYPAYPNPANKTFAIQYSLNEMDSVVITLNSTPTTVVKELTKRRSTAGTYLITVNGSELQPAFYRVYISVFRQSDVLSSYGDVQIIN